jgi:hypothetical protein
MSLEEIQTAPNKTWVAASQWTPEQNDEFRRLWAEGKSATVIAEIFGTTRNAVLGKRKRMGLPHRETLESGIRPRGPDTKPRAPKMERIPRERVMRFKPAPFIPRLVDLPEPSAEFRCDFRDLDREKQCHFPHGDENFQFCGHPKTRGPYCDYHAALCWRRA